MKVRSRAQAGNSPDFVGKVVSSSSNFCSHDRTKSMYVGAGSETRRLFWSGQRKFSVGPAVMCGQLCCVQNSVSAE